MRNVRVLGTLCAVAVAAALAGCGGVPSGSVAKVGSVDINQRTFDHWAQVAFKQQQGQTSTATDEKVPVPPDFTDCIAAKKKTAAAPAKGQPTPSDSDYKTQCKTEYESLRDSVMTLLINSEWIIAQAKKMSIKLTDEQVRRLLISQKQQSFKKEAQFTAFLKQTGYTTEDLLYRVKVGELTNRIRSKVLKDAKKASDADLLAYYNKNKSTYGTPATRDIRIVLTKTEAAAKQAKAALDGGQGFAAVAKQYSTDTTSKNKGGLLSGVTPGALETQLNAAAFKAKKGVITGPVKTQFGYYVFEVVKITKSTQQGFATVKEQVRATVDGERQQAALDKFVKQFTADWRKKTDCRKGYATAECKNGPKTATTSTVAPGAVPQTQNAPGADGTTTAQ